MRVLVVEDEPLVGDLFHDSLTQLGHEPSIVSTAEEALARLAGERPDVILLDVRLPGMTAIDFLQLRPIREFGVPIVAVSGVATENEVRDCMRYGALDFVSKPVSLARLRQILTHAGTRGEAEPPLESGTRERRRALRVALEMPVFIFEDGGARWEGVSVDLSAFGMKVRANAPSGIGSTVTLVFTPPDDGLPMRTRAIVLRHVDGHAFYFVGLSDESFQRLSALVQRLVQEGGGPRHGPPSPVRSARPGDPGALLDSATCS
jgi:CheY-like chemotaxis protein